MILILSQHMPDQACACDLHGEGKTATSRAGTRVGPGPGPGPGPDPAKPLKSVTLLLLSNAAEKKMIEAFPPAKLRFAHCSDEIHKVELSCTIHCES